MIQLDIDYLLEIHFKKKMEENTSKTNSQTNVLHPHQTETPSIVLPPDVSLIKEEDPLVSGISIKKWKIRSKKGSILDSEEMTQLIFCFLYF